MDALMASGFITPPSLHYVRNHGAVPKLTWANHRITINGLVDKPLTLSMDELIAMPSVTLPVTLVCAGETLLWVWSLMYWRGEGRPVVELAWVGCDQEDSVASSQALSLVG